MIDTMEKTWPYGWNDHIEEINDVDNIINNRDELQWTWIYVRFCREKMFIGWNFDIWMDENIVLDKKST